MLKVLNRRLKRFYCRLRWPNRGRRSETKIVVQKLRKVTPKSSKTETKKEPSTVNGSPAAVHPKGQFGNFDPVKPIRVATFNAALFSMAPAVPKPEKGSSFDYENGDFAEVRRSMSEINYLRPKSILKQSPLHSNSINGKIITENLTKQQKFAKSKLRVSINLPDNEISLLRSRQLSFRGDKNDESLTKTKTRVSVRSNLGERYGGISRTIVEVLKEVDADILALQDVKAEEEKEMKPLSDLAKALGMNYVFAESWAPEYGNAVLSKWPIKRWKVQKIFDDTDFRNILKATIEVPEGGEVNFQCTHLDHLDENWRMKQINAIIRSNNDSPHILAGGLNSLDESDYSSERWTDIIKYYEEMGKPTPKVEVMKFMKSKEYTDAKDFAGECEPVVMIAKGQSVQGTCKYGTRVDYIMASPNSPYKFVPGSYSVFSSKGTSDHHIVKVDITRVDIADEKDETIVNSRKRRQHKQKLVKITTSSPSKGIWKTNDNQER